VIGGGEWCGYGDRTSVWPGGGADCRDSWPIGSLAGTVKRSVERRALGSAVFFVLFRYRVLDVPWLLPIDRPLLLVYWVGSMAGIKEVGWPM